MSCILRISGTDLNLADLLEISLVTDSIWEKGTPKISTKPDSKKHTNSGVRYVVSEADFDEFELQKADAIEYLEQNQNKIEEIMNLPGVEGACLDFGIHWRDVPVQCDNFPPKLIKLAGDLRLAIELSQYPPDVDD